MDKHIIQFRNGYYSVCFSLKIGLYKAIVLGEKEVQSLTNVNDKHLTKM
jgi:hypothetical protein